MLRLLGDTFVVNIFDRKSCNSLLDSGCFDSRRRLTFPLAVELNLRQAEQRDRFLSSPILREAEEGFEVTVLIEGPEGGAHEGEEEEDQDYLGATGGGGGNRDGGALKGGEGRGLLLHLGLGVLQLGGDGVIGVKLQLHLVLKVVELGAHALEDDILVGIAEGGIELAGLVVLALSLNKNLLVVLEVGTYLAGAIGGDEALQAGLHGVGNSGTDEGVLVTDYNSDDERLLIHIAPNTPVDGLGNGCLLLSQAEGVDVLGLIGLGSVGLS